MSGLRAKNRAVRHTRILEAAASLFRQHGYEAATIEAIAQHADVSIGTIYNYYKNKGDLLVAIVAMEVHEVLASGEKVIAKPPRDAAKAIHKLMANYVEHSLVYLNKDMWRQAMAISTQQPDSPFGMTYAELDVALARQTCALITRLQAAGSLHPGIRPDALADMIFNNTNMMFITFVKSDGMTTRQLINRIKAQMEPVLKPLCVA
jgi:AcrR family transcriptional regulator